MSSKAAEVASDNTPILTISSILKHVDQVYKSSQTKKSDWFNELNIVEERTCQIIHNEFQEAISCLRLWEDLFKKEVSHSCASSRKAIRQRIDEISICQNSMSSAKEWLQVASNPQSVPFQEMSKLLQLTGVLQTKISDDSLLPNISFRAGMSFSEENRHKFWYLATLDVLPHQVVLQHPRVITLGLGIFALQVPVTKYKEKLMSLLKCSLEVEGSKPQTLIVDWDDKFASISVDVEQLCTHTISIQLYHQHISGSPFQFLPSLVKTECNTTEKFKSENQSCSFLKYVDQGDSSSDEDPMMDSEVYQHRRQKLAPSGISMVKHYLLEAKCQSKKEGSSLENIKAKVAGVHAKKKKLTKKLSLVKTACNAEAILPSSKNVAFQPIEAMLKPLKLNKSEPVSPCLVLEEADSSKNTLESKLAEVKKEEVPDTLVSQVVPIVRKASRKAITLERPLRRPRIPAGISSKQPAVFVYPMCSGVEDGTRPGQSKLVQEAPVDGTGNCASTNSNGRFNSVYAKTNDLKNENGATLNLEKAGTFVVIENSSAPKVREVNCSFKDQEVCDDSNAHPARKICFPNSKLQHACCPDICSGKQNDWHDARYADDFKLMLSKIKTITPGTEAPKEEVFPEPTENIEDPSPVLNPEHQNIRPTRLSGKMIVQAYGPKDNPLFKPIGVAELLDGKIVVADTFHNRLALFSPKGVFQRYLDSVHLQRPSALVSLRDGKFAVKDNKSIVIFTERGDFLKTLGISLMRPYGLTVLDDGNLMTVETTSNGHMNLVTLSPDSGLELNRVRVDLGLPKEYHRISKLRFISYHRQGRLLVVDLGLNCVLVVDIALATVISVFGEEGTHDGQFRDPSGIACDSEGYIVVGDSRNHRVMVFDPHGQFMCVLKTDTPLSRPSGLCLTSNGDLLVANYWDNSVVRFSLTY